MATLTNILPIFKINTPLSKAKKVRIIYFLCGKKIASEYEFYGQKLLVEAQMKKILIALKAMFKYNRFPLPKNENNISEYWKYLASVDDYLISK